MENKGERVPATPESIMALLQEIAERQAETDSIVKANALQMAENALQMAENDRIVKANMAETDRIVKANALQMAETDRIVKANALQQVETGREITRLGKYIGGVANNNGLYAEEYFYNAIEQGDKRFFGEKFDKLIRSQIMRDENNKISGELDLILVNCYSLAIIEIKYKAREKDMDSLINKIVPFRERFPEYKNHKIYLGLAAMVFDTDIQTKCIENGIAIIKQVGDTFVINDDTLITY